MVSRILARLRARLFFRLERSFIVEGTEDRCALLLAHGVFPSQAKNLFRR
jgi:hypothetical protein